MSETRDKWKMVDADCRDDGGFITYHVDAYDEGRNAATATQAELRDAVAESQGMNVLHDITIAQRDSLRRELAEAQALLKVKDEALRFYASSGHFTQHQDVWESVSGEPINLLEDENNTATVEDGSIARQALAQTSSTDALDKMLEEHVVGYLPAYELDRLSSGHDARLRSAKFGASALDGDIPLYTRPERKP